MSLLMDALRKAEQSKQKAEGKGNAVTEADIFPDATAGDDATEKGQVTPELDQSDPTPAEAKDLEIPLEFDMGQDEPQPSSSSPSSSTQTSGDGFELEEMEVEFDVIEQLEGALQEQSGEGDGGGSNSAKAQEPITLSELANKYSKPRPSDPQVAPQTPEQDAAARQAEEDMIFGPSERRVEEPSGGGLSLADNVPAKPEPEPETAAATPELSLAIPGSYPVGDTATPGSAEAQAAADRADTATAEATSTVESSEQQLDQHNARQLFTAKLRARDARTARLRAMAVAAVVVILAAGGGFYYLTLDSATQFNVPAQVDFDANRQLDLGAPESPPQNVNEPVEEAPALAADDELAAMSASEPVAPAQDEPELTQVIGGPEPEVSEVIGAPGLLGETSPESLAQRVADSVAVLGRALGAGGEAPAPPVPLVPPPVSEEDTAPVEAASIISFSRREAASAIDPLVIDAYAAYQSGDITLARQLYRRALANDPLHRDALLGLAAIAVRGNDTLTAMDLYSRLLDLDPADPVAQAALMDLTPNGSPADQERQLKRLRDGHPRVAPLAYALGNFYASRGQWTQAQQAYFDALQLARSDGSSGRRVNPDYAFNLAVSLEHLNQAEAARNFYQEALEYADSYPASFDLNVVRSRLSNLDKESD